MKNRVGHSQLLFFFFLLVLPHPSAGGRERAFRNHLAEESITAEGEEKPSLSLALPAPSTEIPALQKTLRMTHMVFLGLCYSTAPSFIADTHFSHDSGPDLQYPWS